MKVADMHCDTIYEIYFKQEDGEEASLRENHFHLDLKRMSEGDYLIQNFALFIHLGEERTGDPFSFGMKLLDVFYNEIEKNQDMIAQVRNYSDIEKNMRAGKMSAMLTLEEGAVCKGDLRLLRDFYRLGARMMTLTWNYPNELAYPANVTEGKYRGKRFDSDRFGLTDTGVEFLEEMERLGIIIDVSHLNDPGIRDVLSHTKKPFVASHSNAKEVCSHPRNLSDELIRGIAERGGVMGINYCPSFLRDWKAGEHPVSRVSDMVRHIKHMRNIGGIECIGLGSDFDGIEGELEIDSASKMQLLERELIKEGFTTSEIEAIFYKNVLRLYREILN